MTSDSENLLVRFIVDGVEVEGAVQLSTQPAPRRFILPVLRQLTDSVVEIGTHRAGENGERISCQRGCDACCRQMVPIAASEAFGLAKTLQRMETAAGHRVLQRFEEASETLDQAGISDRLRRRRELSPAELDQLDRDYFTAQVACPFLEEGACVIHGERPLACREFLVTSDAVHCQRPDGGKVKRVEMPAKFSVALYETDRPGGWIPLILAREFVAQNNEESVRTGDALREVLSRV